jgi:hypothetical protein
MARLYLKTASGHALVTASGHRLYLRDLAARIGDLLAPLSAWEPSGYRIYALNLATNAETYLGFVESAAAPLQLAGVALADGQYEILIRLANRQWKDARQVARFPVTIAAAAVSTPLPMPTGLDYTYGLTDTTLAWLWIERAGEEEPDDFAVWVSATTPVNTSAAPDYVVPAAGPGNYSQVITQGAAAVYVAICARKGASRGPEALLTVPTPPADVASPPNQAAYYP